MSQLGFLARRSFLVLGCVLLLVCELGVFGQSNPPRTPAETVREFYKLMRERRLREAFALSIYKPAIDGLTSEEFEELRPDFEKMADVIPDKVEVSGEQISGNLATVFVKIAQSDKAADPEPVGLLRENGLWIVGDLDSQAIVKKAGKQFFFEARINAHHNEVQAMLQRISLAQLAYASQHNNLFADLPTLIKAGLVPKDIETPETTGYQFQVVVTKDAKRWAASAVPVRYNRTGRLSFVLDQTGLKSGDVGGKLLIPTEQMIEAEPK